MLPTYQKSWSILSVCTWTVLAAAVLQQFVHNEDSYVCGPGCINFSFGIVYKNTAGKQLLIRRHQILTCPSLVSQHCPVHLRGFVADKGTQSWPT
jgi:hypothetical protein